MEDDEKLEFVKRCFCNKIEEQETWTDLKNLLISITKTKIKNFIKNCLQNQSDEEGIKASTSTQMKSDLLNLKTEVDGL